MTDLLFNKSIFLLRPVSVEEIALRRVHGHAPKCSDVDPDPGSKKFGQNHGKLAKESTEITIISYF